MLVVLLNEMAGIVAAAAAALVGPLLPIILGTWAIAAVLGGVNVLQKSRTSREF